MKKILAIAILMILSFGIQAQSESNLVTYKVTAPASFDGLAVDTVFYVTVVNYDLEQVNGQYHYASYIQCYLDTSNVVNLNNDSISGRTYFPTNKPAQAIFNNTVKKQLNDIYGAQNVTEIN